LTNMGAVNQCDGSCNSCRFYSLSQNESSILTIYI